MSIQAEKAAGAFGWVAAVFLLGLAGGAAINFVLPVPIVPGLLTRLLGAVPLVAGIWLFVWSTATFRRHRTALMPWSPSAKLVEDGPYARSRNPIYLAFCTLYLAAALIFDSAYLLAMLLVVFVLFDRAQVPREERYLELTFGEEYSTYRARVRRWL